MTELDKSPYISLNGGHGGLGRRYGDVSDYDLQRQSEKAGYQLLFGVQTSEKTQVEEIENKYGKDWYPVGPGQLSLSLRSGGGNILHINFETLAPDAIPLMTKLVYNNAQYKDPYEPEPAYGIQLNRLPWHEVDFTSSFERISRVLPISRFILQASSAQIGQLDPKEFAKILRAYSTNVSTVLLDDSSGTGKPLDPQQLRPYIDAVYRQNDMPSVAVAGGLNPANVGFKLEGLLADYPNLSIDAETGLRDNYDKANPKASVFSSNKAREFVSKIIELSSRSTL